MGKNLHIIGINEEVIANVCGFDDVRSRYFVKVLRYSEKVEE